MVLNILVAAFRIARNARFLPSTPEPASGSSYIHTVPARCSSSSTCRWMIILAVSEARANDGSNSVACSSIPWTNFSGLSTLQILLTVRNRFREETQKGDAIWATCHIILGWLVDTARLTIELPPPRVECLLTIL